MSRSEFWVTMRLLVERDFTRNVQEDIEIWVESIVLKSRESFRGEENNNNNNNNRIDYEYNQDDDEESIIARNRRLSETSGIDLLLDEEVKNFLKKLKLPEIRCRFSHPQIRSRLERLMGTNRVCLTDRQYMLRLQERILEDYAESMDKRIKSREEEELERVKNLVLSGRIPLDEAPPEMASHPVMLIEKYCNKLIAERRAKIKIPKVKIPRYLYFDDTPDPESGLTIERGHAFRPAGGKLCLPTDKFLKSSEEEDIEEGYMMNEDDYEKLKYENPLVKQLMKCETVEEMYLLADEIIGVLRTIDESHRAQQDDNSETIES